MLTRTAAATSAAALLLATAGPARAQAVADAGLRIAPRWGCAWVAPQLTASWIMFQFKHNWPKGQAPTGTVFYELPAGVKCISAIGMPFTETPAPGGGALVSLSPVQLEGDPALVLTGARLYLSTTLRPGTLARGRAWAEWDGGKSSPTEFEVRVADARPVKQPRRIWTGAAMWPYMIANWPDYYRQYAALGFNHQNLWHGAIHRTDEADPEVVEIAAKARRAGISTSIDASTSWGPEVLGPTPDPDALALFTDGQRAGPCPSYRGPGFERWVAGLARIAASGISFIQSDEETYGSGGFGNACVCARCEGRWREWITANRPGLAYISPRDVIGDYSAAAKVVAFDKLGESNAGTDLAAALQRRAGLEEQYRAWLWFRADLTTERYRIYKTAVRNAAKEFGAKSSPEPMLTWWAGAAEDYGLANCMQDARALSTVIDAVVPQLYFRYNLPPVALREAIRRQAWATQGKAMWAGLDSDDDITSGRGGDFANTPGLLTAAVLETLMAGGRGYCMWAGAYMDTRQWAELAAVNGVIAEHEDLFLEGKETSLFNAYPPEGKGDYFHPYSKEVFVSTRGSVKAGLVLVSDYRAERTPFWVERSTAYSGPLTLTDASSGELVAALAANQWEFRLHLRDLPVRLLVWRKGVPGR